LGEPVARNGGPDAELMARFRTGDRAAFEALFDRHRAGAVSFAARMTGEPEAAENIAHDALVRLAREAQRQKAGIDFRVWLFAALREIVADYLANTRAKGPFELDALAAARGAPGEGPAPPLAEAKPVYAALGRLKAIYREVVFLRVLEKMTYDEIARVTGERPATVRGRMNYAVEHLRKEVPE
jgi:RNA polymerase sigma-70 factor (ECF subfamily)